LIISRFESITLPQSDNGQFMAKLYADDMKNAGMDVCTKNTTTSIVVSGDFYGDLPDDYIAQLMKSTEKYV